MRAQWICFTICLVYFLLFLLLWSVVAVVLWSVIVVVLLSVVVCCFMLLFLGVSLVQTIFLCLRLLVYMYDRYMDHFGLAILTMIINIANCNDDIDLSITINTNTNNDNSTSKTTANPNFHQFSSGLCKNFCDWLQLLQKFIGYWIHSIIQKFCFQILWIIVIFARFAVIFV